MTTPIQGYVQYIRELNMKLMELLMPLSAQLGAWLVVGNAGGLVVAINGILTGTTCSMALLAQVMTRFTVGLGLAFVGTIVSLASSYWIMQRLGKVGGHVENAASAEHYIEELNQKGIEVPEDSPLAVQFNTAMQEIPKFHLRGPQRLGYVAALFYLGSAVAFAMAATVPLVSGPAAFASCAARP